MKVLKYGLIILSFLIVSSCGNNGVVKEKEGQNDSITAKVELYYFHQSKRCKRCILVGNLAKEFVLNSYGQQPDLVQFHDVNLSLNENQNLAEKFKVNWSGLCILYHSVEGDKIEDLTDFAFLNIASNSDTIVALLSSKINNFLKNEKNQL